MIAIHPLPGIGEVVADDDLAALLGQAIDRQRRPPIESHDVLVVTQKIVSKAEARRVDPATIVPSDDAKRTATITGQEAWLVELAMSESAEVIRVAPGVLICRHRLGLVMANAGIDQSNTGGEALPHALLLPLDPDGVSIRHAIDDTIMLDTAGRIRVAQATLDLAASLSR